MINANELRVGNWVLDKNKIPKRVHAISKGYIDGLVNFENDIERIDEFRLDLIWTNITEIQPYFFTKEVLSTLEAKAEELNTFLLNINTYEGSPDLKFYFYLKDEPSNNCLRMIQGQNSNGNMFFWINSVHQLQNLYFSLTNKELEVEL